MNASYEDQLTRIKVKISLADEKDHERKVFGSDAHGYALNKPVTLNEVFQFEQHHNIKLPAGYKAFITVLGNGGPGHYGGAGPYYGIYPLGNFGYMVSSAKYMAEPCLLDSTLTDKKWKELIAFEKVLSDESLEYEHQHDLLFSGLMFIGTMGCNSQMMLILNGQDTGRVVYIDQDLNQPASVAEQFLDWYEKWLDKILSQY